MKKSILKEIFLAAAASVPFVYLALNYGTMAQIVPTHFNVKGVADGFSDKSSLWFLLSLIVVVPYLLMAFLPKLDSKQNFDKFAGSFEKIRMTLVVFMSALGCFIVQASVKSSLEMDIKWLFIGISMMIAILGNYLQTVKPNHFVGIRTPWTLGNEENWTKTHNFGGKLLFFSGILTAIILCFVGKSYLFPVFMVGVLGSTLITVFYSFFISKAAKG